jgi:hypothetical protein
LAFNTSDQPIRRSAQRLPLFQLHGLLLLLLMASTSSSRSVTLPCNFDGFGIVVSVAADARLHCCHIHVFWIGFSLIAAAAADLEVGGNVVVVIVRVVSSGLVPLRGSAGMVAGRVEVGDRLYGK